VIRLFALVLCGGALAAFGQTPCEKLSLRKLSDATITAAESVAAGPYRAATAPAPAAAPAGRGAVGRASCPARVLPRGRDTHAHCGLAH